MDFWYEFTKGIPWLYTRFCVKGCEIQGRENIVSGPKILVANHPNATDGFFLPFIVPEKVYFFIQDTVFQIPFFGTLLRLSDQIPVSAGNGKPIDPGFLLPLSGFEKFMPVSDMPSLSTGSLPNIRCMRP